MSSSLRDYISMLRISAHSSALCLRFIGRVCPYAAPPLLSFLLLPRFSCQLLPHLPNYRLWMCSSDQRITTPPSLCGRPPCLQYHRTVGAAGCAGIERLIRSCADSEVAHVVESILACPCLFVTCAVCTSSWSHACIHGMHVRLGSQLLLQAVVQVVAVSTEVLSGFKSKI